MTDKFTEKTIEFGCGIYFEGEESEFKFLIQ